MILIAILLIALFCCYKTFVTLCWYGYDASNVITSITVSTLILVTSLVPALLFLRVATEYATEISRQDVSFRIYSLNNEDKIQGDFVLGSGSIGTREHYRAFYKDERGAYNRLQLLVSKTSLFLDDSKPPQASYQKVTYRLPWWYSFWEIIITRDTSYDLTVPSSTIIQKFEVK
jgi:hypothetical protein